MLLVAIAAATLAYGLMYSRIEVEKKTQSRVKRVRTSDNERDRVKAAQDRVQELSKRRKSLQDSLKELEDKEKSKRVKNRTMKARLEQSGLSIDLRRFYLYSGGFALFIALLALLADVPLFGVLGIVFVTGLGLPRWTVGFLISRRQNKFLEEFPNALDVMVRSIRSGLPLNDAMRLIASDGPEPVKTEFRRVIESQQVGLSIPDACARMVNTMPLPEVNFFAIVIAIQSQAGGNLSEALSNLSKVLRDRRKMKAKVKALSMEAKASAVIIGSLPFVVSLLVYLTSPAYIEVLFVDSRGHFILLFSAIWMSIGIFVMRQMINFDI
ncbi:type II secretion system F family protein [Rhizobium oryzicola]|uniref:Type II secretion system F family protein n=1 Tax=Rhizobium oryzicola TaxID=1232668 RepID=A0ABT8SQG6_9HYPH|nr:type II secretion system F family protein [Rhizobium oryzicola]MDO1580656.1 type II secretion system F family protein [Rhizobium oryzicola]